MVLYIIFEDDELIVRIDFTDFFKHYGFNFTTNIILCCHKAEPEATSQRHIFNIHRLNFDL